MNICRLCFTTPAKSYRVAGLQTCIACCDEIAELYCGSDAPSQVLVIENDDRPSKISVSSMFWYSGIVRRLIIAAKVKSDITALKRLMTIWETELIKVPMIQNMHAVMPCPSSLWSRLHGRIDVTWFLAERIASIYRIPLVLPPRHTYWKLKKRSQTLRPVDNLLATAEPPSAFSFQSYQHCSEKSKHCLLIDDVVTTGTTLKTCIIAAKMSTDFQFSTLTFSKARHLGL